MGDDRSHAGDREREVAPAGYAVERLGLAPPVVRVTLASARRAQGTRSDDRALVGALLRVGAVGLAQAVFGAVGAPAPAARARGARAVLDRAWSAFTATWLDPLRASAGGAR